MNDISSATLIELALDLSNSLVNKDRFNRLISHVRRAIPCDAVAVLAIQEDQLKPMAIQGLSPDTMGRRFNIADHPRFDIVCHSDTQVRFDADSDLPDPYDGLLTAQQGDLPVHACMALPLHSDGKLIGIVTLDSLTPHSFDQIPERTLAVISAMSAATLKTAITLDLLESRASHNQDVMEELTQEALLKDGGELIGDSPCMHKLKQELDIVASSDFSILISGKTGVGKELVARTLHKKSRRSNGPLVYVNCAALPENLIESELFGHVRGAFTGAEKQRAGKFLIADKGTLFLDEIGEIPLAAQSKLLRALQSGEIQPVGQDDIQTVDVRIIAATNRDLEQEVAAGRFRADLFHRLSVFPINVPSLRERNGDIPLLAGYFLETIRRKLGIRQLKISPSAVNYLIQYDWPGNVRELEHIISSAALRARAAQQNKSIISINTEHCGPLLASNTPSVEPGKRETLKINWDDTLNLRQATEDFQRKYITEVLTAEQSNWAAAARRLKTDRGNLSRLAKRLGIRLNKIVSQ